MLQSPLRYLYWVREYVSVSPIPVDLQFTKAYGTRYSMSQIVLTSSTGTEYRYVTCTVQVLVQYWVLSTEYRYTGTLYQVLVILTLLVYLYLYLYCKTVRRTCTGRSMYRYKYRNTQYKYCTQYLSQIPVRTYQRNGYTGKAPGPYGSYLYYYGTCSTVHLQNYVYTKLYCHQYAVLYS